MGTLEICLIALGVILGIALIFGIWVIASRNGFVKKKNDVEEAFSTMDVYLKKRYDLIPNLVETVKGYAKHESETLTNVMKARSACLDSKNTDDRVKNENALTQTLGRLYKVTENYPQLKADGQFSSLMKTLNQVEGEITSARKYYNGTVKIYNNKVELFPSSIIAKWFKFEKRNLFEVSAPEERENVRVQF